MNHAGPFHHDRITDKWLFGKSQMKWSLCVKKIEGQALIFLNGLALFCKALQSDLLVLGVPLAGEEERGQER